MNKFIKSMVPLLVELFVIWSHSSSRNENKELVAYRWRFFPSNWRRPTFLWRSTYHQPDITKKPRHPRDPNIEKWPVIAWSHPHLAVISVAWRDGRSEVPAFELATLHGPQSCLKHTWAEPNLLAYQGHLRSCRSFWGLSPRWVILENDQHISKCCLHPCTLDLQAMIQIQLSDQRDARWSVEIWCRRCSRSFERPRQTLAEKGGWPTRTWLWRTSKDTKLYL